MGPRVARCAILASAALFLYSCTFFEASVVPPGFAIVYGVSDYYPASPPISGDSYDLTYPDDDAIDMAALLVEQGFDVILRTNEDATMTQLELDFAEIGSRIEANGGSDTRFVFYFAGHGYGDGMDSVYGSSFPDAWDSYFDSESGASEPTGSGAFTEQLLLHDAMPINSISVQSVDDVLAVLDESLSDDELSDLLGTLPSSMQMVVIDACHSGGFRGSGTAADTIPESYEGWDEGVSVLDTLDAITLYLDYGSGLLDVGASDVGERQAIVISASGEQEFLYEGPVYGNGIFTHYLLQTPAEADRNFDGLVTANEAYAYARDQIVRVENEFFFGEGKFVPRVSGGAVDFVLFEAR